MGCDKNRVDSERMLGQLSLEGYSLAQEEEEAERRRIAQEKKENSIWNKAFKGLKKFTKSIIEEEE